VVAACRYLSYKGWKVNLLHWYTPPLGIALLGAVGVVFFLAMTLGPQPYYWPNSKKVSYGNSPPIATRAGWMSIACLPFVLMLGSKENPISWLTRIPHDQLMIFHRWVSWAMFVLALVHTFPFIIYRTLKGDLYEEWKSEVFWWSGVVAILAQAWLQFMSIDWIRYVDLCSILIADH
jgi:Ferric reductase like transmembrane component